MYFVAGVAQGGCFELVDERGQHVNGVACEQDIVGVFEKVAAYFDEVMSHLFHKKHGAITRTEDDIANDVFTITFHHGHDFVCTRVFGSRHAKIVAVEGFVDYAGVRPLCE